MSAEVRYITVVVDGNEFEFSPSEPWGDNPAFFAQQVDKQLDEAKAYFRRVLAAATQREQKA